MRFGKPLFALVTTLSLGLGASAQADSLGFVARGGVTADGDALGAIDGATVFTFASLDESTSPPTVVPDTQTTVENPTGIFMSVVAGTFVDSSDLDLTAAGGSADPYLTLTLGGYSFLATAITSDVFANDGRQINFTGEINGPPGFTPLAALFVISFTQAGGPGNTISYSGTLATVVPEPTSLAMLAVGGLGVVGMARRRRGSLRG